MHLLTGLVCAAIGLLIGPTLAGLTLSVPADPPGLAVGWWRGGESSARRRLVVTALAVVALGLVGGGLGWRAELPAFGWLAASAVVLAVIDLDCHRLPNAVTFPCYGAGLVLFAIAAAVDRDGTSFLHAIIGMACVFTLFFLFAFFGWIGFGDTKLAGALGLYLGWLGFGSLALGLVAGFAVGALVAIALVLGRVAGWKTDVAFGPSLLAGALFAVIAGHPILDAYFSAAVGG